MKNKSLITNICTAVLSVLVIAFLALPYVGDATGFTALQLVSYVGMMDALEAIVIILPLFMLIFAIITLAFSIINILGNVNVIKCEGLLKASRLVNLIVSVVLAVLTLALFIMIAVIDGGASIGFILNLVFVLGMAATTVLTFVFARKK